MAPPLPTPAAEPACEQATPAAEGQRSLPTPFLTKTYQLVDDQAVDDIISWNDDGSTFIVWRPAEFARDLLPKYFKHNNFSSFVRQLNTYGFRKIVPDRWEFANDCFRRGEKRLLCDIHRRKICTPTAAPPAPATPTAQAAAIPVAWAVPVVRSVSPANSGEEQVLSSNSSPSPPPPSTVAAGSGSEMELKEENERLRKENARLSCELNQTRNLCNHIAVLISRFTTGRQANCDSDAAAEVEAAAPPQTLLELMPAGRVMEETEEEIEEDDEEGVATKVEEAPSGAALPPGPGPRPMLFGVSIGTKRVRLEDGENSFPEVKVEQVYPGSEQERSPERQRQPWVIYYPRAIRPTCNGSDRAEDGART